MRSSRRAGLVPAIWELGNGATLRLPSARGGVVVRAERGSLVVTQEGDPVDHVLGPGDEVLLPRGGLAVAWALGPAAIAVRERARGGAARTRSG